jgi:pantoate--beta-alanine ligase
MQLLRTIEEYQAWRRQLNPEVVLGCVPTMGALHAGHAALVERASAECDITVVTVFVNPTQFNDPADFNAYAIDLEQDQQTVAAAGGDVVFAPEKQFLYPDDYVYRVTERKLSAELEGAHRPGHFDGVLTVVMKLLNLVHPHRAYFGEKDYQQLELVRGMVKAFFLPYEIIACPTVRAEDGLALSSRNVRLSEEKRRCAADFPRILRESSSPGDAQEALTKAGFEVDYVADKMGRRLGAVRLGGVRLIDNLPI